MNTFEPVKVESCKNCGFPMRQYNPHSMVMICESCGTRTGDNESPPEHQPQAPRNPLFKLHEAFDYRGDTWQIIGCQSYHGFVNEWDSEDGKWERTPWHYHTWWVINAARELAWVVQDKTGYSWSRKAPITSGIPDEGDRSYEVGHWTLTSAVGEFSYYPAENEQVTSYEKASRTLEIVLDENGQHKEIEAFIAQPINTMDLLRGFAKTDLLAGIKRANLAMKIAFASIFSLIVGFFIMMMLESTLLEIPNQQVTQNSIAKSVNLGSITLDKKGLVEFAFTSSRQHQNGSFEANLVIKDSDNAIVTELPINFWRESGRDSDGAWVEDQYGDAPRIILPNKGKYQLTLVPSALKTWKSITVRATVTRNVVSFLPIILGSLLLVLLIILLVKKRSNFIRKSTGVGV